MTDAHYRDALAVRDWRYVDPFDALAQWESFVEQCSVVGYDEPDYEFYNDRSIRGHLDVLTSLMDEHPGLLDGGTSRTIRHRLAAADEAWLSSVQPDPRAKVGDPEWAQFVPALVSGAFADDLSRTRAAMAADWGDFETRVIRPLLVVDFRDVTDVEATLRPRVGQMSSLLRKQVADYMAACPNPNPAPMDWMDGGVRDLLGERFHIYATDDWLTDGVFRWRPPAAEYVRHYGIGLAAEAIEHMRSRDWAAPPFTEAERESLWRRISEYWPRDKAFRTVRRALVVLGEVGPLERFAEALDTDEAATAAAWFATETETADVAAWDEQDRAEVAGEPMDEYGRLFARARALNAAAVLFAGGDGAEDRAVYEAEHATDTQP